MCYRSMTWKCTNVGRHGVIDGPSICGRDGSAEKGAIRYRKDIDCVLYSGFHLISKNVKTDNYFYL